MEACVRVDSRFQGGQLIWGMVQGGGRLKALFDVILFGGRLAE